MRLLADMHIAPRTVAWLRSLGHDVRRVNERLPPTAADAAIVAAAIRDERSWPAASRLESRGRGRIRVRRFVGARGGAGSELGPPP